MKSEAKAFGTIAVFTGHALASGASLALVMLGLGCEPVVAPRVPTVSLRLRGAPPDATVVIDDRPIGTFDFVAAHGVALPPGVHRLSVAGSGYFPWDRIVEANAGSGPISLHVTLTPVPE